MVTLSGSLWIESNWVKFWIFFLFQIVVLGCWCAKYKSEWRNIIHATGPNMVGPLGMVALCSFWINFRLPKMVKDHLSLGGFCTILSLHIQWITNNGSRISGRCGKHEMMGFYSPLQWEFGAMNLNTAPLKDTEGGCWENCTNSNP